jgi:nucleoside-diphosphate-sugar epimerase
MLHSAAKSVPYECFVSKDTRIPFMAMPDAIKALLLIEKAPRENFSQLIYNVTSFSPSAEEIENYVKNAFPRSEISYEVHLSRQAIVDSWPEDVDDSPARKDWDWEPDYDMNRSFNEYLIPAIRARYTQTGCN